jgi:hypothetical protein
VVRHRPIYGFGRPLEGDFCVADARQGAPLSPLDALHSPPISSADRFAIRKSNDDGPLVGHFASLKYHAQAQAVSE